MQGSIGALPPGAPMQGRPIRPRPPVAMLFAAAVLAGWLACLPAWGDETDPTPILGMWYGSDFSSLEIERDRIVVVSNGYRHEESACRCRDGFEQTFQYRRTADILARYLGPDFSSPEGAPLDDVLRQALGGDEYLTLATTCCCPGEIGVVREIIRLDDDTILALSAGDGVYGIDTYARAVPILSHDDLTWQQRLDAQQALRDLRLYHGSIDGLFGPRTEGAIRSYQSHIGADPTGILSPYQFRRLVYGG
ncbi:MAG: peptidoglycan-binding protein [Rhodospirillaceae bacterium]|nr:peptidoglycan-binding protein [Rhodospirillaceae bacterium]